MADEITTEAAATSEGTEKANVATVGADTSTATIEGVEKTFTQADIDRIVKDRLDKAKAQADKQTEAARAEAERKAAEEQGEFKKLYEATTAELERERAAKAQIERERLIDRVATKHGLPDELRDRLRGETEEELAADAEKIAGLLKTDSRRTPPATEATRTGSNDAVVDAAEMAAIAQRMGLKMPVAAQ